MGQPAAARVGGDQSKIYFLLRDALAHTNAAGAATIRVNELDAGGFQG